MKQRRWAAE